MSTDQDRWDREKSFEGASLQGLTPEGKPALLLPPWIAWRLLEKRTGIYVSRSTFYRFIENGKVVSFRVGKRVKIPMTEIESLIRRLKAGESL